MVLASPGGRLRANIGSALPLLEPNMMRREDLNGLLIGLHDSANETIGPGIFDDLSHDGRQMSVRTPVVFTHATHILRWKVPTRTSQNANRKAPQLSSKPVSTVRHLPPGHV